MPEPITLPCAFKLAGDELTVRHGDDGPTPTIELEMVVGGRHGTHLLDKESARALFNWLGVWLHTQ